MIDLKTHDTIQEAVRRKHGPNPTRAFFAGCAAGGPMEIHPCPACGAGTLRYRITGDGRINDAHCTRCSAALTEKP